MKILFIITRSDTIGGAQIHVRDLSVTFSEQGHQVLVVTGLRGQYNDELTHSSIQSIACPKLRQAISPLQDWEAKVELLKVINDFKPDIVGVHSSKAGILGRLACNTTGSPCIFTAHGWAFTNGIPEPRRSFYRWIESLAEPLADKIICVSEFDRKLGIQCGMSPERLVTVRNGIPDICDELRTQFSTDEPLQITMVARFDKQKDHYTLLEAIRNISGIQLNLVGDGPGLESTKTYVVQNGMVDRVSFWGFRRDVAQLLAKSHIFTLISNWEGLPLTIIEAMRAGLPVVASDVGGVSEAVADEITGYCIPRGDVDVLHDRLSKLVKDAELRKSMGQRGRQRYEAEFTFDRMFEKTFEVYKEVLAKRGKLDCLKSDFASPVSES